MKKESIIITATVTPNDSFVEGLSYYYGGLLKYQAMGVQIFNISRLPTNTPSTSLKNTSFFKEIYTAHTMCNRTIFIMPDRNDLLPTILKTYIEACLPTINTINRHTVLMRVATKKNEEEEGSAQYRYAIKDFIGALGNQLHPLRPRIPYVSSEPMKSLLSNSLYMDKINAQLAFLTSS